MAALSSSSPVYFLHINKTGGSSLSSVLKRNVDPSSICPAGLIEQLLELGESELSSFHYYSGHFGLALPLALPLRKRFRLKMMTLLRDPVARSVSQINAYYRNPGTYFHEFVRSVDCDVDKCLENPELVQALANYQSKSLAIPLRLSRLRRRGLPVPSFQVLLARESLAYSDDQIFSRAISALRRCFFVALSEKMDESVKRLTEIFDVPAVDFAPKVNVSSVNPDTGAKRAFGRRDLSGSALRRIEDINLIDQRIYDSVLKEW